MLVINWRNLCWLNVFKPTLVGNSRYKDQVVNIPGSDWPDYVVDYKIMVTFMAGVGIFLWICVGLVLSFMAGTTHNFAERHFEPALMIILGPVGIPVWWLAEKLEKRKK